MMSRSTKSEALRERQFAKKARRSEAAARGGLAPRKEQDRGSKHFVPTGAGEKKASEGERRLGESR